MYILCQDGGIVRTEAVAVFTVVPAHNETWWLNAFLIGAGTEQDSNTWTLGAFNDRDDANHAKDILLGELARQEPIIHILPRDFRDTIKYGEE